MYKKFSVLTLGFIMIFYTTIAVIAAAPHLKEIMQGLRADTNEIADGLLTDDFDKILNGANNIANHARIPPEQVQLVAAELGGEMPAFKQLDSLVHGLSLAIAAAAKDKDRDRAIEDYHRMLNGCFDCHAAYRVRVGAALSRDQDDG